MTTQDDKQAQPARRCTDSRQILPACANTFQTLAVNYTRLDERWAAMDRKLTDLSKAVIGNGMPGGSLVARVERIEAGQDETRRLSEKFWKVFGVAAALAAVVVAIFK